jgi:magnesium transporter
MATTDAKEPAPRRSRRRRAPPGTAPGTLIADPEAAPPVIRLLAYGPQGILDEEVTDLDRLRAVCDKWPVIWVNVDGLGNVETVARLGEIFSLHRLALEDVVNVYQRSKVVQYPDHLFIVARMISLEERIDTEQVSLFLGKDFVLTFQEGRPGDCFDPVRERIRSGSGRMRERSPSYLAYALLDAVVDSYFPVLEEIGERLERLEEDTIFSPARSIVRRIYAIKRDLLHLRRTIWPMREMINALLREPNPLIQGEDRLYLQDCYDHTIQVMDLVESYRELGSGLMEAYLSSVGNRLNEIVKVLTLFTSIFIPLSFIASIYGMNFNTQVSPWNMPELNWYLGYPFALALMAAVGVGLLVYFRRKGWLRSDEPRRKAKPSLPRRDEKMR